MYKSYLREIYLHIYFLVIYIVKLLWYNLLLV